MTTKSIDTLLYEWLSGLLTPHEEYLLLRTLDRQEERQAELLELLDTTPAPLQVAREERSEYQRLFDETLIDFLALSEVIMHLEPSETLKTRIEEDLQKVNRFEDLAGAVARLIDRPFDDASNLVSQIDHPESWETSPFPGVELFHIDGGPSLKNAIVGFVRIAPGGGFPEHRHAGREYVYVLQGGFRDTMGREVRRGELCISDPDSIHEVEVIDGLPPLIYLVVLHEGLDVGGIFIGPDDARM